MKRNSNAAIDCAAQAITHIVTARTQSACVVHCMTTMRSEQRRQEAQGTMEDVAAQSASEVAADWAW
ncbi:MAG TPA: hypothetical protein VKP58_15665 [Candidatus Acidoferrum sp.]|nr:hypothetical protein [Candidatus Acidoferrum sp.]